tara:strand:- start:114 stop:2180 length:2067 start_codon:yes stop_codon:yes gene_type:complete
MNKFIVLLLLLFSCLIAESQITVNNNPPYNNTTWLIDNVLLGGGVTASNHTYQGNPVQIGWFNAVNTNLGIDSGIVMCTGDIQELVPFGGGGTAFTNVVTDPDLLGVASSVPGLIGQSFTVSSVNDIAILEFDFIPTSDSLKFRYAFGSQEYFTFENTQYNDVFGFFLSGPGIAGPWSGGSVNLAIVPNTTPPLPITISTIHNGQNGAITPINQQYFVPNQGTGLDTIASADGFTTVLTARALVQCGETYHIRLAIADGTDGSLSSYVWLEAGSFSSPLLDVADGLGIDSTIMNIPCNSTITLTADGGVGATYEWFDSTATVISTNPTLTVGPGAYWVHATSVGCPVISDTLRVVADDSPSFDLGLDFNIPCNTDTLLAPIVIGGRGPNFYQYLWNTGSIDSSIRVSEGIYILDVDDATGCNYKDTIIITEDAEPQSSISGGGSVCDDGSTVDISFMFTGLLPWDLTYTNGLSTIIKNNILLPIYDFSTTIAGNYEIIQADDINGCISDTIGKGVKIIVNPMPVAVITPAEVTIYVGDNVGLTVGTYAFYEWFTDSDSLISIEEVLMVEDSGRFYIWVEDVNGCADKSEIAIVRSVPLTQLFVPSIFTPNNDEHNELFVIHGKFVKSFNLKIFNRWGEQLYESNTMDKYWDGTFKANKVQQGSYYYNIEVIGEDGNLFKKGGVIEVVY